MTKREPENKGHRVFISYSDEKGDKTGSDRQIADMICSALESEHIRCWIDHRDIMPGEKWVNAMFNAVEQSKVMVLVFSTNANRSKWVEYEITYALDEKIRIIPFRVDNVSPQGALRVLKVRCQWIDAQQPPQKEALNRLVTAVRTYLEKDKENEKETAAADVEKPGNNGVKEKENEQTPGTGKNEKSFQETDFGDGIIMVSIPSGEFEMGSNEYDDEKPPHTVYLDGYRMGRYAVTVKQFGLFVKDTGYVTEAEKSGWAYTWIREKWEQKKDINWKNPGFEQEDNHPVVCVSWNDALEYCKWLSGKKGVNFKLPTEAQWEKAARGTDKRKYPWGNTAPSGERANFADKQAWLKAKISWADKDIDDGHAYTAPVGSFPAGASSYGLLDMAGNVWEWCSDWYGANYYKNSPKKNPTGPDNGAHRVLRGGGWDSNAVVLRCAYRGGDGPSVRGGSAGFRLCQDN
jgi:formylglycine-generating enzyme required for sulfatase activity